MLGACRPATSTTPPTTGGPPGPSVVAEDISISGPRTDDAGRQPQDLSVLLDEVRARAEVPGLAAAVVDEAGVLAIGVSGQRRADEPGSLTAADKFHLGSDTKAMTALLVARLVDAGTLRWDMTLEEALPELRSDMHRAFRGVTLSQLLRHRGGIVPNATDLKGLQVELGSVPESEHRQHVARRALAGKPRSTPGSKFEYSNLGYVVVGAAIEHATGKPWETVMSERLFGPLQMASCGFGPTATGEVRDQPWAHADLGESFRPVDIDNPPFMGPAGRVHCSLEDWGKFAAVFFDGATFVSDPSRAALTAAVPKDDNRGGGYALGWAVPELEQSKIPMLMHDGSNTVNYASIVVMPTLHAAVLVATNAGGERAQQAVVAAVLELTKRVQSPPRPDA